MDVNEDHYEILGLPSGEEGANLREKDVTKAYRAKALKLHPDKNPDDPNAAANFLKLKSSYQILKDKKARKLFDELQKAKRQQQRRHLERDAKRQRMVSDLEARERAAFAPEQSRQEEERISRKLTQEVAMIRAMHANQSSVFPNKENGRVDKESDATDRLNNLVGVEHQSFEDAVLKKLAQAAQKQE